MKNIMLHFNTSSSDLYSYPYMFKIFFLKYRKKIKEKFRIEIHFLYLNFLPFLPNLQSITPTSSITLFFCLYFLNTLTFLLLFSSAYFCCQNNPSAIFSSLFTTSVNSFVWWSYWASKNEHFSTASSDSLRLLVFFAVIYFLYSYCSLCS